MPTARTAAHCLPAEALLLLCVKIQALAAAPVQLPAAAPAACAIRRLLRPPCSSNCCACAAPPAAPCQVSARRKIPPASSCCMHTRCQHQLPGSSTAALCVRCHHCCCGAPVPPIAAAARACALLLQDLMRPLACAAADSCSGCPTGSPKHLRRGTLRAGDLHRLGAAVGAGLHVKLHLLPLPQAAEALGLYAGLRGARDLA